MGDCITLDKYDNEIPKAGVHAVLQSMLIAKNLKLKILWLPAGRSQTNFTPQKISIKLINK